MLIKILGIDPSMSNTGWAVADYIIGAQSPIDVIEHGLLDTVPESGKKVRKSSDDLRRSRLIADGLKNIISKYDIKIAAAEIPSGTQSARGSISNGICIGILGSLSVPIIEVTPSEVKMASAGYKTADKEDIVSWAVEKTRESLSEKYWPVSGRANDWDIKVASGKYVTKKAEHQADAIAAIEAATKTEQFKQLIAMLQSIA